MQGDVKRVEGNCNSYYCYDIVQKINLPSFQICHEDKEIEKWLSKNLSSTALSGQVVMNSGAAWMAAIERDVRTEMERSSQRLTGRIKELAERYETPLSVLTTEVDTLEQKVHAHLTKMGFVWK